MVGKITRDDLITASKLPVLWGLSKYTTRNALLRSHLNMKHSDYEPLPKFNGNEFTEWGNLLEPVIIKKVAEQMDCRYNDQILDVFGYEDFFECSLDGILFSKKKQTIFPDDNISFPQGQNMAELEEEENVIIECKTTQHGIEDEPPLDRGVLQTQGQLYCYPNAKWVALAVLYRGSSLKIFMYERDKVIQDQIGEKIKDFYKRLKGPDYYPSLSTNDAADAYPKSESDLPVVDLNSHRKLSLGFYNVVKEIKKLEKVRSDYETQIMDIMGLHEVATLYNNSGLGEEIFRVERKTRNYKAQPEKIVPAKNARQERSKKLTIKSDFNYTEKKDV